MQLTNDEGTHSEGKFICLRVLKDYFRPTDPILVSVMFLADISHDFRDFPWDINCGKSK